MTMSLPISHPHRSALFMPASNPRAIAKARALPCDVVILDLEDAVAPDAKPAARAAAVAAAATGGFAPRRLVIRVNGADTPWGADDLACVARRPVDAVLLPKVAGVDDIAVARHALGSDGPPLWAMIESARGLLALPALAHSASDLRLEALVAGTNDLALDLRCRPDVTRTPLLPALAQIVAAARAGGMLALDGVLNTLDDPERLGAECAQGALWGFDGKSLIHPGQIDAANRSFSPTSEQLKWAHAVVAAFADPAHANSGAIRLAGAMIERLHLTEAQRLLALVP